ncbi:unannotated protein [freshwater metagenome]|jgi:uncharacterized membrane protein YeiH|uniref:Unannotated protein n=1 Tax=freshwater metagenome TaxID=449393 RepID=A0A094Q531_9ZZZZ|nr:hypothetical protein [Actinomycetota bacterium]
MSLLHVLDLLSVFVFALVGARVAADRGLDYGGIALVAIAASVSGGTLRNIFLGLKPILITDVWVITSVVAAVGITLSVRRVTRIGKTLLIMDTLGLAIATASGVQLAHNLNSPWFATIILGVITAITGGLLRDLLCQLEPVLLHRETIATSSLCGAAAFVLLIELDVVVTAATITAGIVVALVRALSIQFDLNLPKFKAGSK